MRKYQSKGFCHCQISTKVILNLIFGYSLHVLNAKLSSIGPFFACRIYAGSLSQFATTRRCHTTFLPEIIDRSATIEVKAKQKPSHSCRPHTFTKNSFCLVPNSQPSESVLIYDGLRRSVLLLHQLTSEIKSEERFSLLPGM